MKISIIVGLLFLTCLFYPNPRLKAQLTPGDSIFLQTAVDNAVSQYMQFAQDQSRLNNGRKYKPYGIGFVKDTPFFLSDQFEYGTITYEGGYYNDVELLFDQVDERVILRTVMAIELINERIDAFSISGHHFIRIVKNSINKMKTGFYEKLYTGKIEVYKKEKKLIKDNLSSTEGIRGEIEKKIVYYLQRDGVYYFIKRKKDISIALSGKEKEIQKFIRSNGLSFRNDPDRTLIEVAAYYDQLIR